MGQRNKIPNYYPTESCILPNLILLELFPLDNNLGFCYVVPYKGYAQFQIGWRGYVQLAQRTGQYLCINVTEVKEGEYLGFDIASGRPKLGEPAENREELPDVGYLAYFKLLNGAEYYYYQTRQQIEAFKNLISTDHNLRLVNICF